MTKVLCKKYNQELDAIPFQPLPGELGKKIQAEISNQERPMVHLTLSILIRQNQNIIAAI